MARPTVRGGWVQEKTIGQGGFGTVTLWKNEEQDMSLALKRCRVSSEMTEKHKDRWRKEIGIMLRLNHLNVVNAVQTPEELVDHHAELPFLCMEYCTGGDLRQVLNKPENCCGLPEYQVRAVVHDVAAGIEYLHHTRIIHRDLKPENIVLQIIDEKTVYKIIDLGYAKDLEQGSVCTSFVGTLQYLAPELFSSQRYTCTVDYWSFGILVFEAITGFRPFLPNKTPVKWHQEVCLKEDDDIYVYSDRRGDTKYSKNIPNPNYLCRTSKMYFEEWLRQMLVWDPRKRGGALTEQHPKGTGPKRPKWSAMVDKILDMKIVFILCVSSGQVLSYAVQERNSLANLQVVIEKETKIPVSEQQLLLASGISPDPDKPAEQCWAEMAEEEWLVFLFPKDPMKYPTQDRKARPLPELLQLMVKEPTTLLTYHDQRTVWGQAVYFCSEVAKDYRRLLQGQRAAMMSLLRGNSNFSKLKTKLDTDYHRLQAQAEFFKDGLQYDISKYRDQTATGISSQKLTSKWKKMEEESAKFLSMKDEVLSIDQQCNALSTRVVELQRSPFAKMKRIDVLEDVEKNARTQYERLRQTPKDQRDLVTDNTPMVQIVKRCQRDRDRLTSELYLHLSKISQCKQELEGLQPKLDKLVEEIESAKERLLLLQRQRQGDMWMLLKMTIKQTAASVSTQSSSQPSSILSSQTGTSSEVGCGSVSASGALVPGGSNVLTNGVGPTSSILDIGSYQSEGVVTENQAIKNKLLDLVGSLQMEHTESMNELQTLDWSFIDGAPKASTCPVPTDQQLAALFNLPHQQKQDLQDLLSQKPASSQQMYAQLQPHMPDHLGQFDWLGDSTAPLHQTQSQLYANQPQPLQSTMSYALSSQLQAQQRGLNAAAAAPGAVVAPDLMQQQGTLSTAIGHQSVERGATEHTGTVGAMWAPSSPSKKQGSPRHQQTLPPEMLQGRWPQSVEPSRSYSQMIGQSLSDSRSATPSPPSSSPSLTVAAGTGMPVLSVVTCGTVPVMSRQLPTAVPATGYGGLRAEADYHMAQISNGRRVISQQQVPQISITGPTSGGSGAGLKRTPPKIPPRSTSAAGPSG